MSKKLYTDAQLNFARAYAQYHNHTITRDLDDYESYKQVCTLIKTQEGFKSWSEVNSFLRPADDYDSLLNKYSKA